MATFAENAVEPSLATRHSWIKNREVVGNAGTSTAINPSTGEAFAKTSLLDARQAGEAVQDAAQAFPAWSALSFRERASHLLRVREVILGRADDLARLIQRSQGKPPAEAYAVEIFPALECL